MDPFLLSLFASLFLAFLGGVLVKLKFTPASLLLRVPVLVVFENQPICMQTGIKLHTKTGATLEFSAPLPMIQYQPCDLLVKGGIRLVRGELMVLGEARDVLNPKGISEVESRSPRARRITLPFEAFCEKDQCFFNFEFTLQLTLSQ
jgi:hypothetical protein